MEELEKAIKAKNVAYWERNQLVAALSKIFPAWIGKHPETDKEWDPEWRTIVYMEIPPSFRGNPEKDYPHQLSWHIHDFDIPMFDHLRAFHKEARGGDTWDSHTTVEKYRRLRAIIPL